VQSVPITTKVVSSNPA